MAYDGVPKNARDGVLVGKDATGTPITFTFQYEPGDLKVGPLMQGGVGVTPVYDRGTFITLRKVKDEHPSVSFSFWFTEASNATDGSPYDLVLKQGKFASGVSTLGANADVWTFTLVFDVEGTDLGGSDSTLTLPDCHGTIEFAEGEEVSQGTINAICYGAYTFV